MSAAPAPVLAAGAVVWREKDGEPRVLVVHRTQHKDVSLPKGKLDPGETLPETAVREIAEETGLLVGLGAPIGVVEYPLPNGRPKVVHYWLAEVGDDAVAASTFQANDEIAELDWVTIEKARTVLDYPHDVELVDRFAELWKRGRARSYAVIALRHGKAVNPHEWGGPDATRPLQERGAVQAASVAHGIAAYRPRKLITSTAVRCVATIEPTARVTGRAVTQTDEISQDAYGAGQDDVGAVVRKRLEKRKTAVLCSHGPVLPEILAEIARRAGAERPDELRRASGLGTAEYAVVHLPLDPAQTGVIAVEVHGPAA
ncbi:NUDIX domain-containing protein [Schumannella sp. 10F1B-5-1]|uniref:NUDIX hydrolase n=1 Tax=Schumannella sp. 10F1B-5-1 TaxID=2590780 RepID=UPI0011316F2B|nr:NUDIX domain-containing protein [Schumannella sp. 10F1B-5-1]TPW72834.1 NUDIX hydrolase [Schumannella sp. 10F1B-5-1]